MTTKVKHLAPEAAIFEKLVDLEADLDLKCSKTAKELGNLAQKVLDPNQVRVCVCETQVRRPKASYARAVLKCGHVARGV